MNDWNHRHVLDLSTFSIEDFTSVLELAKRFSAVINSGTGKIPALQGRLITTLFFKKWKILKKVILDKKKIIYLFITSILIFGNWSAWIYAVSINKIIDASIGYFIFPILSVFFGYIFF